MRRISIFLAGLCLLAFGLPASAASATPGQLVKIASRSDVYYVGTDGKRYVFPNEKIFFSWYSGFNGVTTISDTDLAALSIGGAVTYRPGTRLVKLTTDPKVYAVAAGGALRWVKTEAMAASLYGSDWNVKIDDLSDAFFSHYKLGEAIDDTSDYSASAQTSAATTISRDRGIDTSPVPEPEPEPEPSGSVNIQVSKSPAAAGDTIIITGEAAHPSGIQRVSIFFDNVLVTACSASPCAGETTIPISGTKASYGAKVVAEVTNATTLAKSVTLQIDGARSPLAKITVSRSVIRNNQLADAIVDADASIAVHRIDIFVNDVSRKACASSIRQCRWTEVLSGDIGSTFEVHGVIKDTLGRSYITERKTITIGTNDSPLVTGEFDKSDIYTGETVNVTVTASDDDGISKVEVLSITGEVIKTCTGTVSCTASVGPWNAPGTYVFNGRATDVLGLAATSESVGVNVDYAK